MFCHMVYIIGGKKYLQEIIYPNEKEYAHTSQDMFQTMRCPKCILLLAGLDSMYLSFITFRMNWICWLQNKNN